MKFSQKVFTFSLFLLLSAFVFTDAFGGMFGGGKHGNVAIETLLATGILTLLLKGRGGKHHSGGHGHEHIHGHGGFGGFGHAHGFGGLGHLHHFGGGGGGGGFGHGHSLGLMGHSMPTLGHAPVLPNMGHLHGLGHGQQADDPFNFDKFPELKEFLNSPDKNVPVLPQYPSFPEHGHAQNIPAAHGPVKNLPMKEPGPYGQNSPNQPDHGGHSPDYPESAQELSGPHGHQSFDKYGQNSDVSGPYNGFGGAGHKSPVFQPNKNYRPSYTSPRKYKHSSNKFAYGHKRAKSVSSDEDDSSKEQDAK